MNVFIKALSFLWTLFKWLLIPAATFIGFAFFIIAVWFVAWYVKGNRLQKGEYHRVTRPDILKNLIILFPMRYIKDLFSRDPEFFRHQGCIIFTGRQGAGKTVAMVEQAMMWQNEYPKAKVISNLGYKKQDDVLDTWEKLIDYKNGIYGVICLMDETQNWFSSNNSKNFPPEMLEVITQNRKNRRVILGTAQSFNRLAKPLREQATEVRKCFTIAGCLTIVHRVRPELDSSGDVKEWKHVGFYYFVHTDKIRNSYDTYRVIESLRQAGFQDKPPVINVTNTVQGGK